MAGLWLKIATCNSARHLPWLTIHCKRTSMLCYRSHPTVIYVMLWLKCTESILLADNFLIKEYSSFAKMISAVCASWFVGRFCTCMQIQFEFNECNVWSILKVSGPCCCRTHTLCYNLLSLFSPGAISSLFCHFFCFWVRNFLWRFILSLTNCTNTYHSLDDFVSMWNNHRLGTVNNQTICSLSWFGSVVSHRHTLTLSWLIVTAENEHSAGSLSQVRYS